MPQKKIKQKLLIATDCFLPRIDGIARFLDEVIPYLKKHFEITVIAPHFDGEFPVADYLGIRIIRLPVGKLKVGDYKPPKINYSLYKMMKGAIKESDIIWTQTVGPIGTAAMMIAKREEKPLHSYVHSHEVELLARSLAMRKTTQMLIERAGKRYLKNLYNKCDSIMVPSEYTADVLNEYGVYSPMNIVHMGVDGHVFRPWPNKKSQKMEVKINPKFKVIGYCGRIAKEKDLLTLHHAFEFLKEKRDDIFLLIVGDGLESIKKKLKGKNIKITGFTSDVLPYLHAMDMFVLPSLTETTSLSTMEAMSTGLPVIATPVGYVRTYIRNGVNGFLFSKKDVEGLVNNIENLLDDETLAKRIGQEARMSMLKNYSWRKTSREILNILDPPL